jgi:DNA polymerase-3 subunit epsilon
MQFAVVDLETTGGSASHDRIVEVGIVWFENGSVTREYRQLINPERHIPWNVSQIHGITDAMVENQPTFPDVAEEIFDLTADRIFVAHNVQFDYGFLKESFRRCGMDFERRRICTVRFSKKLNPGQRKHSLKTLCHVYGIENERAHRALEDAKATALVLGNLLQQAGSENILRQLLNGKGGINLLPPNLSYQKIEGLPNCPGVYLFHDSQGKVLYVGKAVNIRDRVRQHFSGHTHTGNKRSFLDSIYDLSFVETGHELMALLTENELIKKHYPR